MPYVIVFIISTLFIFVKISNDRISNVNLLQSLTFSIFISIIITLFIKLFAYMPSNDDNEIPSYKYEEIVGYSVPKEFTEDSKITWGELEKIKDIHEKELRKQYMNKIKGQNNEN